MERERQEIVSQTLHRGPHLGAVSMVYTALLVASFVVPNVRIAAFLQFGAAVPLGIFTATIVSRLRFLGVNVAGVFISLFGGFAASLFAAISAMLEWVLAHPGVESQTDITRILNLLRFATGGVGYVVPFGLLLAGVSVIAWFTKMLPRWLVWLGMVVAGIAELSSLALVFIPAAFLVPTARFVGLVWMIATGFLLPRSRAEVQQNRLRQVAA